MALAEAVAAGISPSKISWRFSYPEAFRKSEFRDLSTGYTHALRSIISDGAAGTVFAPCTESEAAALYFHKKGRAYLNETVIVLDVGGSTTDIAVWHDNKFLWRNSLRFAGRNILLPFLLQRPNLVAKLTEQPATLKSMYEQWKQRVDLAGQNEKQGNSDFVIANALDVIINQPTFAQAMQKTLPMLTAKGGDGELLRMSVQTAFAGILYYVGLQLRVLNNVNWDNVQNISICLGGRGSLLFRNVLGSSADEMSQTARILSAATGKKFTTKVAYTADPKHEVAYGLVAKHDLDNTTREVSAVLGEGFIADGIKVDASSPISSLIGKTSVAFDRAMPSTRAFTELLRKEVGIELNWDGVRDDLVGKCGAAVVETGMLADLIAADAARGTAVEGESVTLIEPPFAIALRSLIGLINSSGSSKALLKQL
jgi:hypothetical protein